MGEILFQALGEIFGGFIVKVLLTVAASALATPFILLHAVAAPEDFWMRLRDGYLNVADWIWSW